MEEQLSNSSFSSLDKIEVHKLTFLRLQALDHLIFLHHQTLRTLNLFNICNDCNLKIYLVVEEGQLYVDYVGLAWTNSYVRQ